jgi:tetratricopeptide (TPR) repeat protein
VWAAFAWAQSYHFDYHYFLSHLPAFIALAAFGIEGLLQGLGWLVSKIAKCASSKWIVPATVAAAGLVGLLMLPSGVAETKRSWPNYRAAGAFLANRLNPEDRYYVKPDDWLPTKIGYYLRDVADQGVGIQVFTNKEVQERINSEGGTLYIVTPQAFRRSSLYISRSFHGAAINWRDPCSDSSLEYWDTYERMQSSAGEVTAKDLLSEAKQFEQAGELPTACKILIEAASRSPHLYAIQRRKAEVLAELGRYTEAVETYEAAFERAPPGDRWWMLVGKAESLFSLGMDDRGMEVLRQALEEARDESEEAHLYEAIGEALLAQDRFDEAAAAFQKSLDLWEGDREVSLMRLAEISEKRGDIQAAIGFYTRAANIESPQSELAEQRLQELRGR